MKDNISNEYLKQMDVMFQRLNRPLVGYPLTPKLLQELKAFSEIPEIPDDYDPHGEWVNTYRIWIHSGWSKIPSTNRGYLRIERLNVKTDTSFTLRIKEMIINDEGFVRVISAEMDCMNDCLACPVRWFLSSEFFGPDRLPLDYLSVQESVRVNGNQLGVIANGRRFERQGSIHFTSDWSLFDAIQRLPMREDDAYSFDVFEGLSLLRLNHHLSYHEVCSLYVSGQLQPFHVYKRIGEGVLPYTYWLDRKQRLLFVITSGTAYILDDDAVDKFNYGE